MGLRDRLLQKLSHICLGTPAVCMIDEMEVLEKKITDLERMLNDEAEDIFECPKCGSSYFTSSSRTGVGHCGNEMFPCSFTWKRPDEDHMYFHRTVRLRRPI